MKQIVTLNSTSDFMKVARASCSFLRLVVTCWEWANPLALLYVMFSCRMMTNGDPEGRIIFYSTLTFPCCVLAQIWYLIVSIPNLCLPTYFVVFISSLCIFNFILCPECYFIHFIGVSHVCYMFVLHNKSYDSLDHS